MADNTMEIEDDTARIETVDQGALEDEVHVAIYEMRQRGEMPSLAMVVRTIVGHPTAITGSDAGWYRVCATAHVVTTARRLLEIDPTLVQTVAEARAVAKYYADHAEALEQFVRAKQDRSHD